MKNYLMYAIESLAPNSDYVIFGDEYSGIEWRDTVNTKPTEEQVTAKIAEIKAAEPMTLLRDERNILLAQSDWTQLPDSPLSQTKKNAWSKYRQQLRDMMASYTDSEENTLDKVIFPKPPK